MPSDYEEEDGDAHGSREDLEGDEVEEDEGRDARMLLEITRLPVEVLDVSCQIFLTVVILDDI